MPSSDSPTNRESLEFDEDVTREFAPAVVSANGTKLERLGDYRILREVGRGGMGIVYEAEQESLGRHVALKVLPASALLNPTYLERFRREAKAAAKLHHTNIVPVFGVGQHNGVHFYAMQFIRGEGLDRVLAEVRRLRQHPGAPVADPASEASVAHSLLTGRFGPPTTANPAAQAVRPLSSGTSLGGSETGYYRGVAWLGVQVAEALAYAHRQGVLHRDIKPSNLLLDEQGTVWVTDFGLAKAEGADDLTHVGDIVGTLRFMAPERFEGQSLPRSDIYALGLTLYELLTLRPAFADSDKARLIDKVLHEPPIPPRQIDPRIPRDLETIVLKCLAKLPQERYATAEALAEDLKRFLADRPIQARRSTWHERAWRWCRRNPAVATLSGALLALLVVTAIAGVVMTVHLRGALAQALQAERLGKKQLFETLVSEAHAQRTSGRAGQRLGTLASIRKAAALAHELEMPPATFDELRDLAISALSLADIHLVKEWEGWPAGSQHLAFDDTFKLYARDDPQGNITVRRIADDVEIGRRPGDGPSDGRWRFEEGGQALLVTNAARKSRTRWPFDASAAVPLDPQVVLLEEANWTAPTADKKLLATLNRTTGVLGVRELATGKHLRDIPFSKWTGPLTEQDFMWVMHPWRHELAIWVGSWDYPERPFVRVLDLDRGTVLAELVTTPPARAYGQMAWHPDGRTLAVAYDWSVVLWDVPTRQRLLTPTHNGGGLTTSISRSGQLMSTHSIWAGGVKFWHPHTGKLLLNMPGLSIHPTAPTPDGRMYTDRIVGQRLQVWATEPSPVLRILVRGPSRGRPVSQYRASSIHRDGLLLAVGSSQGVSLFDLARGIDVGHLDIGFTLSVKFDPATGDLLTFGARGLLRWPVRWRMESGESVRIGPPRVVRRGAASDNGFDISQDGQVLAVADFTQALVLSPDPEKKPLVLGPLQACRQVAVSPDGRWVVTAKHSDWPAEEKAQVWDARTGKRVKELALPGWSQARFSPDSQWLFGKNLSMARFWRVGTWEEGIEAPAGSYHDIPAFSPAGNIVAYERGDGALRLVARASGKPLATLENPDQGRCHFTTFTPDGMTLVATNMDSPAIHVWDLRALRRLLAELDLDWAADA